MIRTFHLWVTVARWHDGDTFYGVLDQGYWTYRGSSDEPIRMRCALIDTPELPTPEGKASLAHAQEIAPPGLYECVSYKPDEYGRPLLDLLVGPEQIPFSERMLTEGFAVAYKR